MRTSCGVMCAVVVALLSAVTAKEVRLRPHWPKLREECGASAKGSSSVRSWREDMKDQDRIASMADDFTGMFVDEEKSVVVVGAKDAIFHLNMNRLTLKKTISTAVNASAKNHCLKQVMPNVHTCHNYNRLLLNTVKDGKHIYLECGTSAYRPTCVWRLTDTGNVESTPIGEASRVCPHNPDQQSIATLSDNAVYAATFGPFGLPIIGRNFRNPELTTPVDNNWLFRPRFIDSYERGDFMYFFLREKAKEAEPNDTGRTIFRSFMKARITCTLGKDDDAKFSFNLLTNIFRHNGSYDVFEKQEDLLYATFHLPEKGPAGSAVCVYRMHDIDRLFNKSPFIHKTGPHRWSQQERVQGKTCEKPKINRKDGSNRFLYLEQKAEGYPILLMEGVRLTNIIVDRVQNYDIMFLGTDEGEVLKVTRYPEGGLEPLVIDRYKVSNLPLRKMIHLPTMGNIVVTTKEDIYKINYLSCLQQWSTCRSCVIVRDPYCGWCPTNSREADKLPRCVPKSYCLQEMPGATGTYLQDVNSGNSEICGKEVEIVQPDKRYPKIVNEKSDAVLEVKVKYAENLHWQRGGGHGLMFTRHRVPVSLGERIRKSYDRFRGVAKLTIARVKVKDMDFYHLTASNNISVGNATVELVVRGKPRVISPPQNQSVRLNESALFHCKLQLRGRSFSLKVTWQFRAATTETWKQISMKNEEMLQTTEHSLIILHVQEKHIGEYQCLVRNDDSRVTPKSAWLHIIGPPTQGKNQPEDFIGMRNDNLTVVCGLTGNVTRYAWLKDSQVLDTTGAGGANDGCHGRTVSKDGSLSISCAQRSDCGVYQCEASNDYYSVKGRSVNICVHDTKREMSLSSNGQCTVGGTVVLNCIVPGAASLEWTGPDGTSLTLDDRYTLSAQKYKFQATEQHLAIVNAQPGDSGSYSCIARSKGSIVNHTQHTVRILPAHPQFLESPPHLIFPTESDRESPHHALFYCHVRCNGSEVYVFNWLHNGQAVEFSEYNRISLARCHSHLSVVVSNDIRDQGVYECRATLQAHNSKCFQPTGSTFGYLTTARLPKSGQNTVDLEAHLVSGQRSTIACPGFNTMPRGINVELQTRATWQAIDENGEATSISSHASEHVHVTSYGKLRFKSFGPSEAGYYTCSAGNRNYLLRVKLRKDDGA